MTQLWTTSMRRLPGCKKLVRNSSEKWLNMKNYIDFVPEGLLIGLAKQLGEERNPL
jgi:hypothetical protein